MVLIGDTDTRSKKPRDEILTGIEIEFQKSLLHGDTAASARRFVAVIARDDRVFDFQFGKQTNLFRKIMAYKKDEAVERGGRDLLIEITLIKSAAITGDHRFVLDGINI